MSTRLQRALLAAGTLLGVLATPATARAQKALVYCPVNVDASGCNTIVTALTGAAFPLGVDRGYDGTGGTVDLKTVDLFAYAVFVVPSLADLAGSTPYAKLRDVEVVEHLKAALIGRIALWSGTPDQGTANRAMKDALIQNLAGWASGAFATAKGPGLVALLDASTPPSARYDWLRAVTPLSVSVDENLLIYDAARSLTPRGTSILTSGAGPIAYQNMATYGFTVPNGAAGVSLDALGQTGSSQGGQVILLTAEAGNSGAAIVRTDKGDYAPGETVTITGSGWQAGEAVKLTLHMDPLRDSDTELMATADGSGTFTNTQFSPQQYDIGVRFVVTAVGQASGMRAQTTFTDAQPDKVVVTVGQTPSQITPGGTARYIFTVSFNGNNNSCTVALTTAQAPPPAWPASPAATFNFLTPSLTSTGATRTDTLDVTMPANTAAPNVYKFTITADGSASTSGCQGNASATSAQISLDVIAPAVVATSLSLAAPNPSSVPFGSVGPVTLAATLTRTTGGAAVSGATVDFTVDGSSVGSAVTNGSGVATLSTYNPSALGVGPHNVQATFTSQTIGGTSYSGSTSGQQTLTVTKASTSTTVLSSVNPSGLGQSVTFTATVSPTPPGAGIPTGTVQFKIDGNNVGSPVALSGGSATFTTSSLAVGNHTVEGVYSGDSNFLTSTGSLSGGQTVNKASTSTSVSSSVNPSVFGQSVTFTATVSPTPPGGGTPTGTVQFKIDGSDVGSPVTLSGGSATFATASLTVGNHTVDAVYSGDGSFLTSTGSLSGGQTVNKANTSTSVSSNANPSVFGQSVTFTATVAPVAPGGGTPTGTVQFKIDGVNVGGAVALSGGTATFSTSSLAVGTHTVEAVYSGDGSFLTSTGSLSGGQTVNKASTSTTVSSGVNPSVFGQSVTFTATVSATPPGGGTPAGTVQFKIDGSDVGSPVALSGGSATFATSSLAVGNHTVEAVYGGDANFATSTGSLSGGQTVNQASTSTSVSSSVNPSVFGQSVTFTATVAAVSPGGGTPTGTVQFKVDGNNVGAPVALSGGSATFATSSLAVGNHTVEGVYSGDSNFLTSTGSLSGGQTVNKASTSTSVSSSVNPSVFGQSVTFTATVSPVAPGAGTPTGTVQFTIDGVNVGGAVALSGGTATFSTSTLAVGNHTVGATYSGDSNFLTSAGSLSGGQTVNKASTSTSVSSSVNPSVFGQSVTFTATVSATPPGAGTPTGTVQFKIDGSDVGSPVALSGGSATYSTGSLAVGNHSVEAVYSGDGNFLTSTGSLTNGQTVNKANTSTSVSSSVNPSVFGQSVTFTATVTAVSPGAGTPTGTVQFTIDGANAGSPVSLSGGSATLATATLAVGNHTIAAVYSGDGSFLTSNGSLSGGQTVNKASTSTSIASDANPSVFSQVVTFTATVTVNSPGAGTPSGTVTFKEGATTLGSGTLNGSGVATFSTSALSVGSHNITAYYAGDASFTGSTSSALTQVVNKASTTTALTSAPNPSVYGQTVTFTATVSAVSPATAMPTGSVTFHKFAAGGSCASPNGTQLGTSQTLSGGTASVPFNALPAGPNAVTACYAEGTNFKASEGAVTQTVYKAELTITASSSSKVFGTTGTVTPSYSGFVLGETATALTTAPTCASLGIPASALVSGSPYETTCSAAAADNYKFKYVSGQLVVTAVTTYLTLATPVATQYSDKIKLSASVSPASVAGSDQAGSVAFFINGSPVGSAPLVNGTATKSDIPNTRLPGNYNVTATFTSSNPNFGHDDDGPKTLTITKEDAGIVADAGNAGAINVSQNSFTLKFSVKETNPEPEPSPDPDSRAAPGDITLATLTAKLTGISSSSSYNGTCTPTSVSGTPPSYSATRNFTCTFSASAFTVDAYTVELDVTGDYYVGSDEDAVTVFDPAAGFVTGGGKIVLDGDRVSFGFSFTYTKGKTTPRGGIVVVRHHVGGGNCRVKSNQMDAPAVNGTTASFSGKGNYTCVDAKGATTASAGNQNVLGYVEDNGTSGAGQDKFWLRAYGELMMALQAPGNALLLTGGNIQVPQPGSR